MSLSDQKGKSEFNIGFQEFKKRSDSDIYEKIPKKDVIGGFVRSNAYFELSGADVERDDPYSFRQLDISDFIEPKRVLAFFKISGEYSEDLLDTVVMRPKGDQEYKAESILSGNLLGGISNCFLDEGGEGGYIMCPTNQNGEIEVSGPPGLLEIRLIGYIPKVTFNVEVISEKGFISGQGQYTPGSIVHIDAEPDSGYLLSDLTVLSGTVSISNNTFLMPEEDVTLEANYKKARYTVEVTGDNGSPSGSGTYKINDTVKLSPNPDEGYGIVRWQVDYPNLLIKDNRFIMPPANLNITAIYGMTKYTVSIISDEDEGEPTGAGEYLAGESVILDPNPKKGYRFKNWTSSLTITDNQFLMPKENITITANYEEIEIKAHFSDGAIGANLIMQSQIEFEHVESRIHVPYSRFHYYSLWIIRKVNPFTGEVLEEGYHADTRYSITHDEAGKNQAIRYLTEKFYKEGLICMDIDTEIEDILRNRPVWHTANGILISPDDHSGGLDLLADGDSLSTIEKPFEEGDLSNVVFGGEYESTASTLSNISEGIDSIILEKNVRLKIYPRENFTGSVLLNEEGPLLIYSENASAYIENIDPSLFEAAGLTNADGTLNEDLVKVVTSSRLTMNGSFKIEFF